MLRGDLNQPLRLRGDRLKCALIQCNDAVPSRPPDMMRLLYILAVLWFVSCSSLPPRLAVALKRGSEAGGEGGGRRVQTGAVVSSMLPRQAVKEGGKEEHGIVEARVVSTLLLSELARHEVFLEWEQSCGVVGLR